MRGIRVDEQLLADAEAGYEETLKNLDARAELYADQFHKSVIVPFCDRHNLRFWSGNGVWFFESPSGKTVFEDPEEAILDWARLTGNARYVDDPRSVSGKSWVMGATIDSGYELPEFYFILTEIHKLLNLNFMSGVLGYWINDHKPSTFPDRDWELRGEKR